MRTLASLALLAASALSVGCPSQAVRPDPLSDPCGVEGPTCAFHPTVACCDPGYRCGGEGFDEGCPAGACCLNPTTDTGGAELLARRPATTPMRHPLAR